MTKVTGAFPLLRQLIKDLRICIPIESDIFSALYGSDFRKEYLFRENEDKIGGIVITFFKNIVVSLLTPINDNLVLIKNERKWG